MVRDIIVLDHKTSSILVVSNIYCDNSTDYALAYDEAVERISQLLGQLSEPTKQLLSTTQTLSSSSKSARTEHKAFIDSVDIAKDHVRAGDVFQVVLSQRMDIQVSARPIDVYRVLRALIPSPYVYFLNYLDCSYFYY